jgi:hypothetical protein
MWVAFPAEAADADRIGAHNLCCALAALPQEAVVGERQMSSHVEHRPRVGRVTKLCDNNTMLARWRGALHVHMQRQDPSYNLGDIYHEWVLT